MPAFIYGLAKVLIGNPAVDGGMSTSLAEIFGNTVLDSVVLTTEEGTTNQINIEENDTPIISQTIAGAKTISFSTYNTEPAAMLAAFGGTLTGTAPNQVWNSPANLLPLTRSVRIEDKGGRYVAMPKVALTARFNTTFGKSDAGRIDFTGTILQPDKVGVSDISMGNVGA